MSDDSKEAKEMIEARAVKVAHAVTLTSERCGSYTVEELRKREWEKLRKEYHGDMVRAFSAWKLDTTRAIDFTPAADGNLATIPNAQPKRCGKHPLPSQLVTKAFGVGVATGEETCDLTVTHDTCRCYNSDMRWISDPAKATIAACGVCGDRLRGPLLSEVRVRSSDGRMSHIVFLCERHAQMSAGEVADAVNAKEARNARAEREAKLAAIVRDVPAGLDPIGWRAAVLAYFETFPVGGRDEIHAVITMPSRLSFLSRPQIAAKEAYRRATAAHKAPPPERRSRVQIVCDSGWDD